jgi:hypothetical protein
MAKVYYISGTSVGAVTFNGQPITAQSVPVLDGWGWGEYWQCAEWMAWHFELKKVMTAEEAAIKFISEWNKQDSTASPYNWCKYDPTFRNYMKSQGVDIDSIVSAILMPVFNAAGDLAQGGSDLVSNTADTVSTVSSLIKPVAIIALIGLGIYGYKTFIK